MPTDDDPRFRAWRLMLEAHAATIELLSKELEAGCGMPIGWYDVLFQLHEADGGRLRMVDLARAVLLSKSGLTRLVDRMEREGLVSREVARDDRRSFEVSMTPEGEKRFRKAARVHLRGIDEHWLELLSDPDGRAIEKSLRAVRDAARAQLG
jgi:DNA-binding MarR family transcriptional regulator